MLGGKQPVPFNPIEWKPEPCACGHNTYRRVEAFAFMQHRLKPDGRIAVPLERFECAKCGRIRNPKTGESRLPSEVDEKCE